MKTDKIDKELFIGSLNASTNLKELSSKIGIVLRRENQIEKLNKLFSVNIRETLALNLRKFREKQEEDRLNQFFKCDNPECGRIFQQKEHDVKNKSGKHYCSDECGRHVSCSAKREERNKKTSNTLKSKRYLINCSVCGKEIETSSSCSNLMCDECKLKLGTSNLKDYIYRYLRTGSSNIDSEVRRLKTNYCFICGAEKGHCKHPEICSRFRCFPRLVKYFKFDIDTIGSEDVFAEFNRVKEFAYDLYWNKEMTITEIKNYCGYPYSAGNFSKILGILIPFRSAEESYAISVKHGRNFSKGTKSNGIKFKSGFHKTWDDKVVFYRSSYEFDLCNELDNCNTIYEMESLSIEYFDTELNRKRFAIPDFYLPETNTVIEVKSLFTYKKQNMIDRAKAIIDNGYNFALILEHKRYDGMSFVENTTEAKSTIYDF